MTLKALYSLFKGHPEGQWVIDPNNAQSLYKFVKEHPIKRVLDLGTGIGCSAAVIALALKDKGEVDYHIDSVEQYEKCLKLANELIPSELKEHITIHHSPVKVWQTEKIPYQHFSIFETLPEPPENGWDLIVVDGPAPFLEGEHYVELPNGDAIKLLLENKIKPGAFVAWDGRTPALKIVERYFGGNFYLAFTARPDFNVLERKDNPLFFEDLMKEVMAKETNYFR